MKTEMRAIKAALRAPIKAALRALSTGALRAAVNYVRT
jgi:hypothetical protein